MKKVRLLIYLQTNTEFKTLFPLAKTLSTANFEVMLGFISINTFTYEMRAAQAENISYISIPVFEPYHYIFPGPDSFYTVSGNFWTKAIMSLANKYLAAFYKLKKKLLTSPFLLTRVYLHMKLNEKNQKAFSEILNNQKTEAVIMAEDSFLFGRANAIKIAVKHGVRTFIFPFTLSNEREPSLFIYEKSEWLKKIRVKGIFRHMLAYIFPEWVYRINNVAIFRWYPEEMIAGKLSGTLPRLPWRYNYGMADYIFTESEFMREYYLRNSIPEAKVINTGTVYQDLLANSHSVPLSEAKQNIVMALIPDFKPNPFFSDIKEVWTYFVQTVRTILPDYLLTLSIHPRTSYDEVYFLEAYGCKVAYGAPVDQLLKNCDLFIASVSATIRMALFFNVPVINFDLFRYEYDDYEGIAPVKTVYTREAYESILKDISTRTNFLVNWKNQFLSYKDYFGKKDEKNTQRILNAVYELSGK